MTKLLMELTEPNSDEAQVIYALVPLRFITVSLSILSI